MAEQDCNPFSSPSSETDLVLLVEGKKLHVSKLVLSLVSPVFKTMLEGDYKEKHTSEISFPEKKFDDMLQFLLCVYPSTVKSVTIRNLDCVLALADEYCVESLKQRCEEFVLSQLHHSDARISNPHNVLLVHLTLLGDMYKLKAWVAACVDKLMYRHYDGPLGITMVKEFDLLSSEVKLQILDKRMRLVEASCRGILRCVGSINVERTRKCITDPTCPACKDPAKNCHVSYKECRYTASNEMVAVIDEGLGLGSCFPK
ncbi:BTB and MATH domain-containing protein 36-like [Haliotis asinina]|uniref:BTB and MATH domain-containing protein 36-like n=1 Tax=Haliotis asinina TaxID=109174 RepID=UPI00353257F1